MLSEGTLDDRPAPSRDLGTTPARPRYLWVTWIDPMPERDGQRLYSGRLMDAVAEAGADIEVLCFSAEDSPRRDKEPGNVGRWHRLYKSSSRPSWLSPLSRLPNIAYRSCCPPMRQALRDLLMNRDWDAVIIDGLASGWALPVIQALPRRRQPRIVHVSHNHEASTRRSVAEACRDNVAKRLALFLDADKAARLERKLVAAADVTTAITQEDADRFKTQHPDRSIVVMPPGYSGAWVSDRAITSDLPRRAIIVGSFHWIAKRLNLKRFVDAADPLFAAAGVELQIVGSGPATFMAHIDRTTKATTVTGAVEDVEPYLRNARIAVVPETAGGGFKLKILDYVFHRVPIMAVSGSTAGTPLEDPDSLRQFDSPEKLAHGVVAAMDQLDSLDRQQRTAYRLCAERFDWGERGRQFLSEVSR